MGFGTGVLDFLGVLGKTAENAPADIQKAQQIKMTAQKMEDDRITNGTKNLTMLMNLGAQMPTLQASPGYQDSIGKAFSAIGIDPKTLPKNASGGIDLAAGGGSMSAEFQKNFANPTNYKAFSALDTAGRNQAYTAWGGTGTMPQWLQALPQSVAPVPQGLNQTITEAVKTVQGGGDPTSSIGLLKTGFDQMPEGPTKDQMLNDAVSSVLSASTSPQAKLAIATKNGDYQKLMQDYKNAITTGKVDAATLQEDMARVGLIKAQTTTEQGKPAVQRAQIAHDIAGTMKDYSDINKNTVDTQHVTLENDRLVSTMQWNQAHGLPLDTTDLGKIQNISSSLSNQVKQWSDVKTKLQQQLQKLGSDIKLNAEGRPTRIDPTTSKSVPIPTAEDTQALQTLQNAYHTANTQLYTAQQRQAHAQNLLALPNGARPFAGAPKYKLGQEQTFKGGQTYKKIKDGSDSDPNNWVLVSGGGQH